MTPVTPAEAALAGRGVGLFGHIHCRRRSADGPADPRTSRISCRREWSFRGVSQRSARPHADQSPRRFSHRGLCRAVGLGQLSECWAMNQDNSTLPPLGLSHLISIAISTGLELGP